MAIETYGPEGYMEALFRANAALNDKSQLASTYCTGFYSEVAPPNAVGRYIVWSWRPSVPDVTNGRYRFATEQLYVVKVVGKTKRFEDLQAAANIIDSLLHGSSGTYQDRAIRAVVREDIYRLVENTDAAQYRHLGGYYRFFVQ